jgi:hypothetical protein
MSLSEQARAHRRTIALFLSLFAAATAHDANAQVIPGIGPDSAVTVAGKTFKAGGFHRALLGDNYRDLWVMPVRVPVLHITTLAGGVKPYKLGGGNQTKSLRMLAADSAEYVFRPIFKSGIRLPDAFKGTLVWWIFEDAGSGSHPGANVAAVQLMNDTKILNPHSVLVFMPDDPALGEYRKEFGGVLGTIEEYPAAPKVGRAYENAVSVHDAEGLLAGINKNLETRVDDRALLRARLVDLLIGDNDRHADQWRWARLTKDGLFEPVPRDRDKVFVSYEGMLLDIARLAIPSLVRFRPVYSNPTALFENATQFDRRLLGGLDKAAWQETADQLEREITNDLIDKTLAGMPVEYASRSAELAATLRVRRDHLSDEALKYFSQLFYVADAHGTDTADVATVIRQSDGSVDVTLSSGGSAPWFNRHYDPADTREIRIYLHGGNDSAIVTGNAASSIPVRVIGGNGTNTLVDQSVVAGKGGPTYLYDQGSVTGVKYAPDSALERSSYVDALNSYYNRRPWVHAYGRLVVPQKDYGKSIKPVGGLKTGHGLGVVPKVGIARYVYGFRKVPYSSMIQADVAYATGNQGWKADLLGDKRFESSDFHIPAAASVSQIEVIQFRGLGNDVVDDDDPFFDVKQTQWQIRPAVGVSFAPGSDITFGPIARYTKTDSASSPVLALTRPYGFRDFAQAGVQLAMHFDSRVTPDSSRPRVVLDFVGSGYPGFWDAHTAYESIEGSAVAYATLPVPTKPVIAVRGGGKKLYGNFPYFDAAFLGGGSSFRTEHRQRFAGDASLYGSTELRVPIAKFPFILPLDVGALGFADAGRVYVDGDSPGGWHTAAGGGFWVGAVNPGMNVNVLFTNRSNRRVMVSLGFAY